MATASRKMEKVHRIWMESVGGRVNNDLMNPSSCVFVGYLLSDMTR